MVELNLGTDSNFKAIDYLANNGNQKQLERIAFIDHSIGGFKRGFLNLLIKSLYIKGVVEIRFFKTKRKAAVWLKE